MIAVLVLLLLLAFLTPRLMVEVFVFGMWLEATFPGKGYYIIGIAASLWSVALYFSYVRKKRV